MRYDLRKNCEECAGREEGASPLSLQETIWKAQLENYREIIVNGEIDSRVIEKVVVQIQNINRYDDKLEAEIRGYVREPLTLFINSTGGLLAESLAVADAIMVSRTPVHTVALGTAASGGFLMLIAGDKRYAQRHATVLYRMGGYIGKFQDYFEHAEYLEWLQERIHAYVTERTGITREDIDVNRARKHDWIFTLEELLEKRVIDGIWGVELEEEAEEEDVDPCEDCVRLGDPEYCNGCVYYDGEEG